MLEAVALYGNKNFPKHDGPRVAGGGFELNASLCSNIYFVGGKSCKIDSVVPTERALKLVVAKSGEPWSLTCMATSFSPIVTPLTIFFGYPRHLLGQCCTCIWVTVAAHEVTHCLPYFYTCDARRLKHE